MQAPVNLYVAYYASQRTGQAVHSPSSCLPGGGWRIEQFDQREVPGVQLRTGPLRVNRAVIRQGLQRMMVYYWFQERGRDITSEYLVKWYLLVDALTQQRTDGALVRLITPMREGEDLADGDARLQQFSVAAVPELRGYLPD
jgi:EpsI family protein